MFKNSFSLHLQQHACLVSLVLAILKELILYVPHCVCDLQDIDQTFGYHLWICISSLKKVELGYLPHEMIFMYSRVWLIIRHVIWIIFPITPQLAICCFIDCFFAVQQLFGFVFMFLVYTSWVSLVFLLFLLSQKSTPQKFYDWRVYLDHSLRAQPIIRGK